MNKLLAAALLAGLASAANAATYTVDFNSYTLNQNLRWMDLGGVIMESRAIVASAPSGSYGILPHNAGTYKDPFFARFTISEVTSVSVDLGDWGVDADSLYLEAYDAFGTLLADTASYIDETYAGMRTLSLTTVLDIAYVKFYGVGLGSENNVYADNLVFSTRELPAVVPAPAAGLLLASGLGLAALWRRRGAKSAA